MKKTTQIIASLKATVLAMAIGVPLFAQDSAPQPDRNTRVAIPPIVTSGQAKQTDTSRMLAPMIEANGEVPVASPALSGNLPPIVSRNDATSSTNQPSSANAAQSFSPVPPIIVSPSRQRAGALLAPIDIPAEQETKQAAAAPEMPKPSPSNSVASDNDVDSANQSETPVEVKSDPQVVATSDDGLDPAAIRTAQHTPPIATSSAGIPLYPAGHQPALPFAAAPARNAKGDDLPVDQPETSPRIRPQPFARSDAKGDMPYYANSPSTGGLPLFQDLPGVPSETSEVLAAPSAGDSSGMLTDSTIGNNDYFDPGTVIEAGEGCGNPSCAGCYGLDAGAIQTQMGCCGFMTCARNYVEADALYMTRNDAGIQGSNFFGVGGSAWGYGIRTTIGHRYDCANGTEFSYMGTTDIPDSATFNDPVFARLNANWIVAGGFTGVETTGFFNAVTQTQNTESMLHSLEWNKTEWAWDVFKSFYGLRYIYFDNDYDFFSQNVGGTQGLLQMDATNHLLGAHIGSELFYDVGYRLSYSLVTKAGGYLNASKFETRLYNNGIQFLDNESNDGQLAASFDLGFQAHYQLRPRARLRMGYNLLWLWGVVTSDNNFPTVMHPGAGRDPQSTSIEGELMHGANFGIEIFR